MSEAMLLVACNIAGADRCSITYFACDPEARMLLDMEHQCRREGSDRKLALDTADRLGLADPENDQPFGCRERFCERCREPWQYGLTLVGGDAICDPCMNAEATE